jgi:branched-chain amino acid transport system permease protein
MTDFLQLCFNGIALGCIYALIGLGFAIIFKASEVINFAQGEFLLVGAYVVGSAYNDWHLNFLLAVLIGIVVTAAIGILFERTVLRRMIGRPVFSILMITIGLDTLLLEGVSVFFGTNQRPAAVTDALTATPNVGGVVFPADHIWAIVVTSLICVLLFIFFRFTKYGLAMRATAIDQEAALAMGINIRTVYALAWAIAGVVATIGGVFLAIYGNRSLLPTMGSTALLAFPAIILGGLDSVSGAVIGGILIGLAQLLTARYQSNFTSFLGDNVQQITPYILMLIILLIRPYGLFGKRKVERV